MFIIYFRQFASGLTSLLLIGGGMLMLLVFTLPHRNGMSLAIDYLIRRKAGDLADDDSPQP